MVLEEENIKSLGNLDQYKFESYAGRTENEYRVRGEVAWCKKCNHTHALLYPDITGRSVLGPCFQCACENSKPAGRR